MVAWSAGWRLWRVRRDALAALLTLIRFNFGGGVPPVAASSLSRRGRQARSEQAS